MTLLISTFATIAAGIVWYTSPKARDLKIGVLCLTYLGASLMWSVDAIAEYIELRAAYFMPAPEDMINDAFLGFSVVALGLIIWMSYLLIKDPLGVVRETIRKQDGKQPATEKE